MRFGVVGTGVIGSGWAVRALSRGWEVIATDPSPGADVRLRSAVANAWPAVRKLGLYPDADPDRIDFVTSADAVGEAAEFIQESAPRRSKSNGLCCKRSMLPPIPKW